MERADAEAQEAEQDMAAMAEKLNQSEAENASLGELLQNLRETAAISQGSSKTDAVAALAKRDARIEELASQLEAQKATLSKLNQLLQVQRTFYCGAVIVIV